MIRGTIRNREAIIELEVSGSGQSVQQIEAVIDTGYNGYLTLPDDLVAALRLPFAGHRRGRLADGNVIRLDVYLASVVWHVQQKDVLISQAAGTPLIGMSLLNGNRLTMDVIDGGDVSIEELTHRP
ncbi:MAG: clan AA aspartic protease [Planctomycetota bacterium]|nr:clan AA aspartic protease [Planctomycetota bacterium]